MISEGLWDAKDRSNDADNSALNDINKFHFQINLIKKHLY